jgi:hypothetical protein
LIADQLARQGSSHSLIAPEPALGIAAKIAREVIKDWMCREHKSVGRPYVDTGSLRACLENPLKKNWGIAQSEEKQLRIMTGLLTGHFHLKGHLFKFGLINSPESDCCKQASDTYSHVLCDCEALATLRFRRLGCHFTKPGDFEDISVSKILHLVQGARLPNE